MRDVDRRAFLAASGAIAGSTLVGRASGAGPDAPTYDHAIAVLYDATRCIGCRSCLRACRSVNDLEPEVHEIDGVEFDLPTALSDNNWMVLQVYRDDASEAGRGDWTFMKLNCMHCNDPACASACPVAALRKTDTGPVVYFEDRCIGCRYCLLACPFHVPCYEWVDRTPLVRKCNWNRACVRACPVGALEEGPRSELIARAHQRIAASPARYVDHVYGEHEAGGTSYLVLAGVEHEKLGLPKLSPTIRSHYADSIMKGLPGWILGIALFLGGLYQVHQRQSAASTSDGGTPPPVPNPDP